jgi:hypothetical protein
MQMSSWPIKPWPLFLAVVAALGCATPASELPYDAWSHREATAARFATDQQICLQAATVRASLVSSRGNVLATEVDERRFEACMGQRGWARADQD